MNIQAVIKSVHTMHGGERDQLAKHRAYLDFLRHKRSEQAPASKESK